MIEFRKVSLKNKELNRLNLDLTHEKKKGLKEVESLTFENQNLKDELKKIKSFIEKFIFTNDLE